MEHLPNGKSLPLLPIILAGSPHLEHWPLSRLDRPLQFERRRGAHSPFQRALLLARSQMETAEHGPPIVCVSAALMSEAIRQSGEVAVPFDCIVEPMDRGAVPASLCAAIRAEERLGPCLVLVFDVLALPKNEEDLTAFTTQAIASQVLNQHMLVAADRPAPWKSTDTLRVQAGTSQGHPRQFSTQTEAQSPVAALGSIDPAQKSRTEQRFYDLQDVVLTPSHLWRTAVSRLEADPTTAIETALTQRPTSLFDMPHQATERALWPNAIHYATAKHAGLKQVFETAQSTVVFRPLAMASAVEEHDHGQSFALLDSVECQTVGGGHMVALVGCDGLRVVTSEDATLVTRNETPEAPSDLIDAMKARRHVALQSAASVEHNWGRMQTVAEQNGHRLVQLSVEPTSSTPMEVHMRRTEFWYVLAGYGLARVGGTLIALEPGSRLDIPPRVPHAITNSGDMPLVIMEARRGEMLGNNDTYPAEIEPDAITEFA